MARGLFGLKEIAAQGTLPFWRAGHLRWSYLWPLLAGLTAAFLGGWLYLPSVWFERLVALVLLICSLRFVQHPQDPPQLLPPAPGAQFFSLRCCSCEAGHPPGRRRRCRRCSSSATLSVEWRGCCFRVRQARRVARGLDAPASPGAFAHEVGHRGSASGWLCRVGCATAV